MIRLSLILTTAITLASLMSENRGASAAPEAVTVSPLPDVLNRAEPSGV